MITFSSCELSTFQNDLANVTIRNSIQTDKFFDIFPISRFLCTNFSKTNRVKNLKHTLKVAHVIHKYTLFTYVIHIYMYKIYIHIYILY